MGKRVFRLMRFKSWAVLLLAVAALALPFAQAGVVTACGTTLTSGNYWLERDVDCTSHGQNGVTISGSGVTLDCAGHAITGKGGFPTWGVHIEGGNGVTVKNCKIDGFFFGIGVGMSHFMAGGGDNHVISGNTVTGASWANIYTYMTHGTMISNNQVTASSGTSGIYIAFQSYSTQAVGNTATDIAVIPSGDICNNCNGAGNAVTGNKLTCGIYTEDGGMAISNNEVCAGSADGAGKITCSFYSRFGPSTNSPSTLQFASGNTCDVIDGCGENLVCHQCSNAAIKPVNTTVNESWITVPADAAIGTSEFAVMAYEAKLLDSRPFSKPDGAPWTGVNRVDARASCEDRGPEYHLVTQREALAISRNIERTVINNISSAQNITLFANGSAASNEGKLSAAASPAVSSCNLSLSLSNAQNAQSSTCQLRTTGYDQTGGSWANESWRLRTHVLSNGEVIWDWAGNAWEWIATSCLSNNGSGCDGCYYGATASPLDWLDSNITSFERGLAGPNSTALGIANNTGTYVGCTKDYNPLVRGGYNTTVSSAAVLAGDGIYALNMNLSQEAQRPYLGFRCVRNLD